MSANSMPLLTIKLHQVERSIQMHLGEHAEEINRVFAEQVKAFCTPEHVQKLIKDAVAECVPIAINNSVRNYFSYGDGRDMIQAVVNAGMPKAPPQ